MHPDYAFSLNNVGYIYEFNEDYDKALDFYMKSEKIRKITLG
jgi:CHASE1-domain containing sensor protein